MSDSDLQYSNGRVMMLGKHKACMALSSSGTESCGDMWTVYIPADMPPTDEVIRQHGFTAYALANHGRKLCQIPVIFDRQGRLVRYATEYIRDLTFSPSAHQLKAWRAA